MGAGHHLACEAPPDPTTSPPPVEDDDTGVSVEVILGIARVSKLRAGSVIQSRTGHRCGPGRNNRGFQSRVPGQHVTVSRVPWAHEARKWYRCPAQLELLEGKLMLLG